jgi:uncharacterized membrane protein
MRNIITSALFVALITVTTMFVKIPLALFGYVHLGDLFIFLACYVLSPKYSIAVGGVGSALADLFLAYTIYAPATFVIKALVALVFALIVYYKPTLVRQIVSVFFGTLIIGGGYLLYETCLYGFSASIVNLPFNLIQGAVCGVLAIIFIKLFEKIPPLRDFKNKL